MKHHYWEAPIVIYLFLGGLGGGIFFLSALFDLIIAPGSGPLFFAPVFFALAALALCLTCGLPLPAGIPPMLLQWLILPLLALLAAAVQAGRLLAGLRAALAGKPDGRLFCLLAAIGALALAALGKGGSSAAAGACRRRTSRHASVVSRCAALDLGIFACGCLRGGRLGDPRRSGRRDRLPCGRHSGRRRAVPVFTDRSVYRTAGRADLQGPGPGCTGRPGARGHGYRPA